MNLVRIGEGVLNLDNMTHAELSARQCGADGTERKGVRIHWNGGDATYIPDLEGGKKLCDHLADIATDLDLGTPEDRDFAAYKRNGGTLPRHDWAAKHARLKSFHNNPESWWDDRRNFQMANDLEHELLL